MRTDKSLVLPYSQDLVSLCWPLATVCSQLMHQSSPLLMGVLYPKQCKGVTCGIHEMVQYTLGRLVETNALFSSVWWQARISHANINQRKGSSCNKEQKAFI